MAKKKDEPKKDEKSFSLSELNSFLSKEVNPLGGLISDDKRNENVELLNTGVYVLNALLSSRIYGGIASNRVLGIGGESGTGKTYLCLNIARLVQKQGYFVLYLDSEAAIDKDLILNFGIDPTMIRLEPIHTVEGLKIYMAKLLKKLAAEVAAKKKLPKMIVILDSLGNLASEKEIEDAEKGDVKSDMTRAKVLKSMFRIIVHKLGLYNVPMVMTNHTYFTQEMYPKEVFSGGTGGIYCASTLLMLSKAKLRKEDDMDELDLGQSGITVTAKTPKNRMAKPKKVKFDIEFTRPANPYNFLEYWCTKENFDKVGIAKGKKKIKVDEETGEETVTIEESGVLWYVRHLDKHIPSSKLHNEKVFTPAVLDALEPILHNYFRYSSLAEIEEMEKRVSELDDALDNDDDDTLMSDDINGDELFS